MTEFEKLLIELESEYLDDLFLDSNKTPVGNVGTYAIEGVELSNQLVADLLIKVMAKDNSVTKQTPEYYEAIFDKCKQLTVESRKHFAECYLKNQHFNEDFKNNLIETFGVLK